MQIGAALRTCVTLGLLCLLGCGSGETHFINDKPITPIPEPTQPPSTSINESFTFGRPDGTPVIAFVIYPRKSLSPVRDALVEQLPTYLDSLLNGEQDYRGIHFAVVRDVSGAAPVWYSPDQQGLSKSEWKEASLTFLRETLQKLEIDYGNSDYDSVSPFEAFERVARAVPKRVGKNPGAVWLSLNYIRDGDWIVPTRQQEAVKGTLKSFKRSITVKPASLFRTSLELMAHFTTGGECDPLPSRIATSLQSWLGGLGIPLQREGLCSWLSANPTAAHAATARIGKAIHEYDRKIVLQSVPKLETLEVRVEGALVPKQNILLLEGTNEIAFRQGAQPAPGPGSLIQVKYEPKED